VTGGVKTQNGPRSVLVVHPERLIAEAITSALAAFPCIVTLPPATSAIDADARLRRVARIDAAAVERRLWADGSLATRLRRGGARVVGIGETGMPEDEGAHVSTAGSISTLVTALVPAFRPARHASDLSPQQSRVLYLIGQGLTTKQIARHLSISPKTVEEHKSRIFARLGVRSQAAAVRAAVDVSVRGTPDSRVTPRLGTV
jgi:DNA-binding CsgD family transcriptional regulator